MPNPSAVFRVVITEVAVVAQTNCGTCADDYVELYNAGTATADISTHTPVSKLPRAIWLPCLQRPGQPRTLPFSHHHPLHTQVGSGCAI